jgi:hypothetical protein
MNARRDRIAPPLTASHNPKASSPGLLATCLLGALVAGAGCGGTTALPTGFGVNLTISLDPGVRDQVRSVNIHVTGAEQFDKIVDITAFSGNQARVHYVPGVQAGVLNFSADALDAGGAIVAHGSSGPVTLIASQAVSATVDIVASAGDAGAGSDARDASGDRAADALGPGKKGEPCGAGGACLTGLTCADGVCCETACQGNCSACNLAGREGTCSPIPAGMAPATGHSACGTDAPSSCQKDGTCDGSGACRLYPVGTTCRASKCDPTTDAFTPDFKCDGRGVCDSNIALPCAPYKCKDATTCWSACTDSTQCALGKSCVNGSCGLKGPGATCVQGAECASGFCADGVCCDRACTAGCESCALPRMGGTCTPVPMGMDPKGVCPAGTAENAVCSPGGCDGSGGTACLKASTSTMCRMGSCAAGIAVNPATCQSNGACPPISQTVCGVYACGATSCNTGCNADPDCVMGYYCASNRTCQAKKTPGLGCAANNECQPGLTCLDSVCCMTSACPNCRNCGSDGTCSLTVGSAAGTADSTGNTCSGNSACNAAGVCLGVLGQACGSGTGCVSGNCVDGVCCSVASCGTCRNCGATGSCTVQVANTDDTSGTTCSADNTCDATATCKARWSLVGKVATVEAPYNNFTAGAGNFIYFGNPNNSGGGAEYLKSFNVTSSVFADESKTNNPLCACGYEGTLVPQPLDNRVYYAANNGDDKYFIAGATGWTLMSGTYPARGEAATAVSGKRIYYVAGRSGLTSVQAYDTTAGTWITTGILDAPVSYNQGCAGAFGGVVYVFGGSGNLPMNAYTESTNKWAAVAATPPQNCYLQNLPVWRNAKLIMSDSQFVRIFNPSTQLWETPIPLPALTGASGWTAVTAGSTGELYVLGWAGGQTSIYKWVFN